MRFPFVSLGLVPEGAASVLIERFVGQRPAAEILLTAVAREMAGMKELAMSPENIEAVTAFMEKRDPDFDQFRS